MHDKINMIMDKIFTDENLCLIRESLEMDNISNINDIICDISEDSNLCLIRESLKNNADKLF